MRRSSVLTRVRAGVLIPLSVAALMAAAACVPPPEPEPDPSTPWLAAGCLDSTDEFAPDVLFSGVANVVGNAQSFVDEEGTPILDGSCDGLEGEGGTIVRAATQAAAITVCADLGIVVHDPPLLAEWGYPTPNDAWACINASEVPEIIEFSGPGQVSVTMFGGTPEEPTETTVPFTGEGSGTWDQASGAFAMTLDVDPGSFPVENSPIGPITVFYEATQNGAATGNFDPATGEGGFSMGVTMTLVGLNSPEGMPQPCDIGTAFEFEGAIDLETGLASVSQENFVMTPPADTDCGGLGALIGPMMTEGTNAATMTFQVFEP